MNIVIIGILFAIKTFVAIEAVNGSVFIEGIKKEASEIATYAAGRG